MHLSLCVQIERMSQFSGYAFHRQRSPAQYFYEPYLCTVVFEVLHNGKFQLKTWPEGGGRRWDGCRVGVHAQMGYCDDKGICGSTRGARFT